MDSDDEGGDEEGRKDSGKGRKSGDSKAGHERQSNEIEELTKDVCSFLTLSYLNIFLIYVRKKIDTILLITIYNQKALILIDQMESTLLPSKQ